MTTATTTPIVHGPLVTERLGRVLTVDLCAAHDHMSVAKDSVLPRSSLVVTTAATRMIELSKAGEATSNGGTPPPTKGGGTGYGAVPRSDAPPPGSLACGAARLVLLGHGEAGKTSLQRG